MESDRLCASHTCEKTLFFVRSMKRIAETQHPAFKKQDLDYNLTAQSLLKHTNMPSVFDGNTHNEVFVSLALIA